jgi:hypothetical protein
VTDRRRSHGAEKFLAQRTIFPENVLHNFNNFVQLPTSDVGFPVFHERRFNTELLIRPQIGMRVTGSYRGMVAGFHGVRVGCEFQMVCQPQYHLNLFMEE